MELPASRNLTVGKSVLFEMTDLKIIETHSRVAMFPCKKGTFDFVIVQTDENVYAIGVLRPKN